MVAFVLLYRDPKRRTVQLLRFIIAVAIFFIVMVGCMNTHPPGIEMDEDSFYTDGLYLMCDGTAHVSNTYMSGIENADVSIKFDTVKTGAHVPVWGGKVTIPPLSTVDVPVYFKVSLPALGASIIDSINCDGSPLELHIEVSGTCMYGLMDASLSAELGIHLAKDGTSINYEVVQNDSTTFQLNVMNISEKLLPEDDLLIMTSGTDELNVELINDNGIVILNVHGNGNLENILEEMMISVDSVYAESGVVIDNETASNIVAGIYYARQLL